jgi:hypothetical protein
MIRPIGPVCQAQIHPGNAADGMGWGTSKNNNSLTSLKYFAGRMGKTDGIHMKMGKTIYGFL